MLEFLRKYQKSFFLVIAIVVISSFAFFGTNTGMDAPVRDNRVLGKAIDGSKLYSLELENLARLITTDREDITILGQHASPNLVNDGVIRNDLLKSGVAETIVRNSWDLIGANMAEKLERAKAYRPYEHPDAPFLSAKAVWERFAPAINREYSELQAMTESNEDLFIHLSRLYAMQQALPPEWMRRVLMVHQQQYKWLAPDPRLQQDDFTLFRFHSAADWFGKNFVDLMAQFIHNAAITAESKGYVVTLDEARADLRKNYSESMKKLKEAKWPVELSYREQIRLLGMDESDAAHEWRKVLLFRRYFNDVGEAAFIDRLPYSEFAAVATEKATIDLYEWPDNLQMKNALDLLLFQTYLKAVSKTAEPLALPNSYLSVDEVAPELVAAQYIADVAVIDKREASLAAPLKEVWQYETSEEAWKLLSKEFPFIQKLSSKNEEERFHSLEALPLPQRTKIDLFARRQLLNRHPEWIDAALSKAQVKKQQLTLSAGAIQMDHVEDPNRLGSLFEQVRFKPEEVLPQLSHFESGEAVFCFNNIGQVADRKIKTFDEAKKDGSLNRLVDRALESHFAHCKAKLPAEKQTKWSDAKEEIAESLLTDLKKELVKKAPKEELHFASLRLLKAAEQSLTAIQQGNLESVKIEGEDPLLSQFKLVRVEKEVARSAQEDWMTKEPFILLEKQWSPVHVSSDGKVHFIYIKEKTTAAEPILEHLSFGKEMLVSDVQRILAEQLLAQMKHENALVIPTQTQE